MNDITTLKKLWQFLIKPNYPPYDSTIPLKDTDPREMKAYIHKDLNKISHSSLIHETRNLEVHQ